MTTVNLYEIVSYDTPIGNGVRVGWTAEPGVSWSHEYNRRVSDEPTAYLLPDGYHVSEDQTGVLRIYGPDNKDREIVLHVSGHPRLVSSGWPMPILKPVRP